MRERQRSVMQSLKKLRTLSIISGTKISSYTLESSCMTTDQKEMIEEVLKLFLKATKRTPEKTHKISHKIQTTNCLLIRQKPYRIPQAYRDEVLKELEEMEKTANRCLGCWCWGCVKSRREWRSTNCLL